MMLAAGSVSEAGISVRFVSGYAFKHTVSVSIVIAPSGAEIDDTILIEMIHNL